MTKERQDLNKKEFKRSYSYEYEDYVCTDALGNLYRPSYISEHFSHLLTKCGLRHIRFHDLRHTFASVLLNNNVPLINVSNFLGHSTIGTTANIYGHLDKASKQATADVMSSVLKNVNL